MKISRLHITITLLSLVILSCGKGDGAMDDSNQLTINYEYTDTRDGKIYEMIQVGDSYWMNRNLEYTPDVGICSFYENDSTLAPVHGKLYDFTAATNAIPNGWHLPTQQEWHELIEHLGGPSVAGGKLKSVSNDTWLSPNVGATDAVGFHGHGSGVIDSLGSNGYKHKTTFWSSTMVDANPDLVFTFGLTRESTAITYRENYRFARFSIRCVKD